MQGPGTDTSNSGSQRLEFWVREVRIWILGLTTILVRVWVVEASILGFVIFEGFGYQRQVWVRKFSTKRI